MLLKKKKKNTEKVNHAWIMFTFCTLLDLYENIFSICNFSP